MAVGAPLSSIELYRQSRSQMSLPSPQIGQPAARDTDPALLRALSDPSNYREADSVQVRQTHSSWVFLAGRRVYKVKKPLNLGFLDYSTLERRRAACEQEVRVNRPLAPGIYLGVRAIVPTARGVRFAQANHPDAAEYAVLMRRFDPATTLAGLIDAKGLRDSHIQAAAKRIARFHTGAEPAVDAGPQTVRRAWEKNIQELGWLRPPADWHIEVAAEFGRRFTTAHAAELQRRARAGLFRDVHGDLRCEHVLMDPSPRILDRIEFDRSLRTIDVASDLAFLAMDLRAHGKPHASQRLYEHYRRFDGMLPSGALRSFYEAHWAIVRAKVALLDPVQQRGDADRLWSLSERLCWQARRPLAIIICGPPASGKSELAAELARRTGVTVISSDVVRKSLAHIRLDTRADQRFYSARFSRITYERLGREAQLELRRNDAVIVDATCRSRVQRALLLARLQRVGLSRLIVRCSVPLTVAMERARKRLDDPRRVSDATPAVVREQHSRFEEIDELLAAKVLHLDTQIAMHQQIALLAEALDRSSGEQLSSIARVVGAQER